MCWSRLGIALLVATAAMPARGQMASPLTPGEVLLEVQAQGEARYRPDTARLAIGVVSTGADVQTATEANAAAMQRVLTALRRAGVDDRYVVTQQINLQPRFARTGPQDLEGQAQITGFVARNGVSVTLTRLDSLPAVIAAAYQAGANSVSGPDLTSDDDQVAVPEARTAALAKARTAAEAYATGLGMKVGRVVRVSERGTYSDTVSYAVSAPEIIVSHLRVPVATGQLRRRVTLWVDYALSPR